MCGICGIVSAHADEPIPVELLRRMNQELHHRGPDESGEFMDPGVGMAMRRLSIVDLAGGHQPMYNGDQSIAVVFNGEIYNHAEIRRDLASRGHRLLTKSDTEVIPYLYEELGLEFPHALNGMFGISLWDRKRRRLVLVRDRLGIKPLYYAHVGSKLLYSSELWSLIQHPEIKRDINLEAFSEYLTFQHSMPPGTLLKDVQKLPPGHIAVFEDGKLTLREYWDLRYDSSGPDLGEEHYVRGFREHFERSVQRRLMSDVPLGVFLSGGVDSSAIVAVMAKLGVRGTHTYSLGYPQGDIYGELGHAQEVAKACGTNHDELIVSSQDYIDTLPRFVDHIDEPVSDSVSILFMMLAKRARQDVTVILSGQGADETLGGYALDSFQNRFDRIRRFQRIPRMLRYALPGLMNPLLPTGVRDWLMRGNSDLSTLNVQDAHALAWQFDADEKRRIIPALNDVEDHCSDLVRDMYTRSGATDPVHQILYVYSKIVLAENLLMHGDKMTMAHSLELRVPFLDHELVEFVTKVPSRYLVRRESDGSYTTKNLLKRAMRGMVPPQVLARPKVPFPIPLKEWFHTALRHYNRDVLLSEDARSCGLYDAGEVEALLKRHEAHPTSETSWQIKNLLFFEMWRQKLVRTAKTPV